MRYTIEPERIEQQKMYRNMGLSDGEYERIKHILNRRPNYLETGIFSVMWSEHCSYKTSKPLLKQLPTEGSYVLEGPGEGAGAVDIGDGYAVVFKIESHNSPSAIEPFEGAATGVGGIVRDVFSMGAKPLALLNALCFGELTSKKNRYLLKEVIRGLAHYGDGLNLPMVSSNTVFDRSYDENPIVNAMCVGITTHKNLQRGIAAGVGNTIIYAGRDTGMDGIHGATFSSDEVDEKKEHTSAIAKGNPAVQKKLVDACLEVAQSNVLIGMQDMGAAGLTSSASEMASKANTGVELNLNLVPTCDSLMNAYDIMLSETQERMLLVVKKGYEQEVIQTFKKHHVNACKIGEVIGEKMFRIKHHDQVVANVPVAALDDEAPVYHMPAKRQIHSSIHVKKDTFPKIDHYTHTLKKLMQQPSIASEHWMKDYFKYHSDVFKQPSVGIMKIEEINKALAMTTVCQSRYVYLNPKIGGKIAVAEAARKLICAGARPLALTDGLNFGNPIDPEIFWQMKQSVKGIAEASRVLQTPVISGNVSLYNQSKNRAIYPTPIIGMVGLYDSKEHIIPEAFQQPGDVIYVIGTAQEDFGGSEIQKLLEGTCEGNVPTIDLKVEKKRQNDLRRAIDRGFIQSAYPIASGGLAASLTNSVCKSNSLGATISLQDHMTVELFSETQSRMIVSVSLKNIKAFEQLVADAYKIGEVTKDPTLKICKNDITYIHENVCELKNIWKEAHTWTKV